MNKKVLLICYYFPPLGLGGVGRPLGLFRKLPDFGWDCHVLTVKPVLYRAYEPELLEGLDQSKIFRSGSRDPQRLLYLLGVRKVRAQTISRARKMSERFFPDSKAGWIKPALRLGRTLCENYRYDAVISTSPPVSAHLIGLQLVRETGIPWIADFRDFWTIYKVEDVFGSERLVRKGQKLLEQVTQNAAAVTAVNPSIVDYLGYGTTITNGYDSDRAEAWQSPPDNDRFTIGLLGHQHDTREVTPLLDMLTRLRDRYPEQFNKLRLLQVGQIDASWFTALLEEHNLGLRAELCSRLPRAETIRILSRVHLFYLGISAREGPGFLPGRVFDLLASGRPIIACTERDSEVRRVLSGSSFTHCCERSDLDSGVEYLHAQVSSFEAGSFRFEPLSEYARQYSSDAMAKRFASVLNGVT